jgi:hypothetical protein
LLATLRRKYTGPILRKKREGWNPVKVRR